MRFLHIDKRESESIGEFQERLRFVAFKWKLAVVGTYLCFIALWIYFCPAPVSRKNVFTWLPFLAVLIFLPFNWLKQRSDDRYVEEIKARLKSAKSR